MATGDLPNNIRKLKAKLKLLKYAEEIDVNSLAEGTPAVYLPVYHYALVRYSPALTEDVLSRGMELYGKSDAKFVEGMYKVMRDIFSYKPPITKEQFFSRGFAERKVIMCCEILQMIKEKANSLDPVKRSCGLPKTVQRPKSAESNQASETQYGVKKRPSTGIRRSPRNDHPEHIGLPCTVVNELTQEPASKPVRHTAVHSLTLQQHTYGPPSLPVRHVADHISGNQKSPPTSTFQSLTENTSNNRETGYQNGYHGTTHPQPVRHVSRHHYPGGVTHADRVVSPSEHIPRPALQTPSISRVCSNAVEVVSIPRGQFPGLMEEDIVEINAQTNDSVLQTPVRTVHPVQPLQTSMNDPVVKQLQEQVQTLTTQLDNVMSRMVLLENRMCLTEAKMDKESGSAPEKVVVTNGVADSSLLADSLIQRAQDFSVVANNRIQSLMMDESGAMASQFSPIRQVPASATGQLFSANEDTFATESEERDRRSSTPTATLSTSVNQSINLQFTDEDTREKALRIREMIRETGNLFKSGPEDSNTAKDVPNKDNSLK